MISVRNCDFFLTKYNMKHRVLCIFHESVVIKSENIFVIKNSRRVSVFHWLDLLIRLSRDYIWLIRFRKLKMPINLSWRQISLCSHSRSVLHATKQTWLESEKVQLTYNANLIQRDIRTNTLPSPFWILLVS